ncbi:hypothetical protein G9A89_017496 [Geosiphon pyriformis]|nr:hypothetical protein G9A89_017496 [Geosiphon pyriformis]
MVYSFCQVCKRNNNEGKRHLYTKIHQEQLKKVLGLEQKNYRKYKTFLKDVTTVQDINKQPDFTCLFCDYEVRLKLPASASKLGEIEERQFVCAHIFNHLVTKQHHSKVGEWFKTYNADRKLIGEFIVKKADMAEFIRRVVEKEREFAQQEKEKIPRSPIKRKIDDSLNPRVITDTINQNGNESSQTNNELFPYHTGWQNFEISPKIVDPISSIQSKLIFPINNAETKTNSTGKSYKNFQNLIGNTDDDDMIEPRPKRFKVTEPFFANLTRIPVPTLDIGEGNVFMEGSIPPWFRDLKHDPGSSSKNTSFEIGPSLDAFLKSKKAEKKLKLNPNRIGANFSRVDGATDKEWLPNFGRVWSSGTRNKSQKIFKRKKDNSQGKPEKHVTEDWN